MQTLFANARVVNVLTSEVYPADVAIEEGVIVAVAKDLVGDAKVVDCRGKFLLPGLIDGHVHIDSSLLSPPEFARAVVRHGTTSVVSDPHEIANVLGAAGVDFMLRASAGLPITARFMVPSCVPASSMETSGARLEVFEIAELLARERVLGLAEVMNFPDVIHRSTEMMTKIELGLVAGGYIDGHAPGLRGAKLQAYLRAGISSDHEAYELEEGREKLRLGMQLFIRDGTIACNLETLLPLVTDNTYPRCSFVCDDLFPKTILQEGHLDLLLGRAVAAGLDPVRAVQLATITTATHFGLRDPLTRRRVGALAPGWHADMVVVDDLESFHAARVVHSGSIVAEDGQCAVETPDAMEDLVRETFHVRPLEDRAFQIPAREGRIRVIGLVEHQLITEALQMEPMIAEGLVVADPERDLVKIACVERHHATGNIGLGFVRGTGLRRGALAISVGHDSHNITVLGVDDRDMRVAVEAIVRAQGAAVAVADEDVLGMLPLPIAGLMANEPIETVVAGLHRLHAIAHDLGCTLEAPLMALSFLSLSVIPSLKITDQGLIDVEAFERVPLFA
ncbi:Adenine deaminase [Planctomycetes bacterium Pan216]|uniref:Adenine deaminase n=1 Tax=Kolteria novifilia TaxID=2527975 RepID=A0A518BD68_9BACT|nr:Adenine deaminase [Planctomycetes bacterium Pan216]